MEPLCINCSEAEKELGLLMIDELGLLMIDELGLLMIGKKNWDMKCTEDLLITKIRNPEYKSNNAMVLKRA